MVSSTIVQFQGKSGGPQPKASQALANSRKHFQERGQVVKYLASGDNGDTIAAIWHDTLTDIHSQHQWQLTPELYDAIRHHMVAVKFAKDDNLEGDLRREIEFLGKDFTKKHPGLCYSTGAYLNGKEQWLSLPFCAGGDLFDFMYKNKRAVDLAFLWHMVEQLCTAMAWFVHGVTGELNEHSIADPNHPMLIHNDIFAGNIVLRPASETSYCDFPDLVITDFGRAVRFKSRFQGADAKFRALQVLDVNSIFTTIRHAYRFYFENTYRPCPHIVQTSDKHNYRAAPTPGCAGCLIDVPNTTPTPDEAILNRILHTLADLDDPTNSLRTLITAATTARSERDRLHKGLDPTAAASLAAPAITNEEIAAALWHLEPARMYDASALDLRATADLSPPKAKPAVATPVHVAFAPPGTPPGPATKAAAKPPTRCPLTAAWRKLRRALNQMGVRALVRLLRRSRKLLAAGPSQSTLSPQAEFVADAALRRARRAVLRSRRKASPGSSNKARASEMRKLRLGVMGGTALLGQLAAQDVRNRSRWVGGG